MKSYSRKDFELTWFSGTGKGGQNRNKHQNCCRIKHIETGIIAVGQNGRDREENQKAAFHRLVGKLMALDDVKPERRATKEIVRTYHFEDNRVTDHSTGLKKPTGVVMDGWIDDFVFNGDRENERPESGRA